MANESYSEFVSGLKSEIERDTNIRLDTTKKKKVQLNKAILFYRVKSL